MPNRPSPLVLLALAAAVSGTARAQLDLPRPSPKASVMQTIGTVEVTITYSRPSVKGRTIWGDLVPWDKVWRAGANEATTFAVSRDVTIDGQKLPAGAYSLHTIPGKTEWTVIVNRDAKQWGSYSYDAAKDALRIKVKPEAGELEEWLTWSVTPAGVDSGRVTLAWEKLRVSFAVRTDDAAKAMATIRESLAKAKPDDWRTPYDAAVFAFDNKLSVSDATAWIARSVSARPNFWNQRMQATILAAGGERSGAAAAAERALASIAETSTKPPAEVVEELRKSIAGWKK